MEVWLGVDIVRFRRTGNALVLLEKCFRRELLLCVGSAVTATSLTLSTFLGGLALGAAIFGRVADRSTRPLTLYAILELGVAATGAGAVALLIHARGAFLSPAVAPFVMLPPTILMGAKLPALTRLKVGNGGAGIRFSSPLYGGATPGASSWGAATRWFPFSRGSVSIRRGCG